MDNQQATQSFQLGYIAAAIDGEGTIGIHKGDQYGNYKPCIKIFNTELKFINALSSMLKMQDIPHYIYISNPKRAKTIYKELYTIAITGYKRVKTALEKITPSLYSKRERAEILMEIIKSRLEIPMTHKNQLRQYSLKELALIEQMKTLNQRGKGMRVLNDLEQDT